MKNLDLLLIRPSNWSLYPKGERKTFLEPIGLEYIASNCVKSGFSVKILDMDLRGEENREIDLFEIFCTYSVRYVGITAYSPLVKETKMVVDYVRANSYASIFVGGPHVSALMNSEDRECLKSIGADFYVSGEGELTVSNILGSDAKEMGMFIDGKQLDNINEYPYPSRNLIDRSRLYLDHNFGVKKQKLASVITSRSCPYQCVFCASKTIFGNKLRLRSIDNIRGELEGLKDIGINTIIFLDDTFTFDKQRTLELCSVIGKIGFSYWLDTRVDTVDDDIVLALKESGCKFITFGVESGSPEILRSIKKGITVEQVKNACELTRKYGISTKANFMIGHSGETRDQVMETIALARELASTKISFYKVIPLPGTKLFNMLDHKAKADFSNFAWYKNPPIISKMTSEEMDELQVLAYKIIKDRVEHNKIYAVKS